MRDTFRERLAALRAFVEENGRYPRRSQAGGFETSLALWMDKLRRKHRGALMPPLAPGDAAALEELPNWSWGGSRYLPRMSFEGRLAQFREFVARHGRGPWMARGAGAEERSLAKWASRVRAARRGGRDADMLTPERVAALDATPFWAWDGSGATRFSRGPPAGATEFDRWLAGYRRFVAEAGRHPRWSDRAPAAERSLASWRRRVTDRYHRRGGGQAADGPAPALTPGPAPGLTPGQVADLEAIPGWAWGPAGVRVVRQRVRRRKKRKRSGPATPPEPAAKRRKPPSRATRTFASRIAELREFVAAHGRMPRKGPKRSATECSLSQWIYKTRCYYWGSIARFADRQLRPEHVAALEAIPGWSWGAPRRGR